MGEQDGLWDEDDDSLLGLVACAVHAAPPSPADVAAAGRAAYTWLTVQAELDDCLLRAWSGRHISAPHGSPS
jgi:hypothetical protein